MSKKKLQGIPQKGGMAVKKKYGAKFFSDISSKRWAKTAEKRKKLTLARYKKIEKLLKKEMSYREIAERTGLTQRIVWRTVQLVNKHYS